MALIRRISRLFTADFNAVLDRLEEPEAMLKHAIREMDDEVLGERRSIARLEHERDTAIARKAKALEQISETDEQLDLCFAAGNDELAKTIVRRKLQLERLARSFGGQSEKLAAAIAKHRERLESNEARLTELRGKAELATASLTTEAANAPGSDDSVVSSADIDVAFLRERERRSRS